MMLKHNFHTSHCGTAQAIVPLHNPFLSSEVNVASSFPLPPRSKQSKRRLRHASVNGVRALLTSTEKSTSVKAVITVLETVGGALTHLGLDLALDGITDVLGRTLSVELVAAELDASKYTRIYVHI